MPAAPATTARMVRLLDRLERVAEPGGFVRFDRFMELALYDPDVGYYADAQQKLGPSGDFYTATRVGPLLGQALAHRIAERWRTAGRPEPWRVVELGPGDGRLAVDLAQHLRQIEPASVSWELVLVERSAARRAEAGRQTSAAALGRVRVVETLDGEGIFQGSVVANELFDALPCRRFRRVEGGWRELGVRRTGGRIDEALAQRSDPDAGLDLPATAVEGATYEFSPLAGQLLRQLADQLTEAHLLALDYGDVTSRWTARDGPGTIAAVRQHRVEPDLFADPGAADLSVFVDVDRLRGAASAAGWREVHFGRQAETLTAWGLEPLARAWIERATESAERTRRQLAVKNLLFGFENFFALELEIPRAG